MAPFTGNPLVLITGGARSGKSSYAQEIATDAGGQVLFIATAEALDEEMVSRVRSHQEDRPRSWLTREEPLDPAKALRDATNDIKVVVLDCLTLLVANLLLLDEKAPVEEIEAKVSGTIQDFLQRTRQMGVTTIVVTNEVGMGVVPDNPLARVFRDLAGRSTQIVSRQADYVFLMVAGMPVTLKSPEKGGLS